MPSAASVKVEKLPANNSANNVAATSAAPLVDSVDNNSPIRQALVIIEHKIRNLEKRKVSPLCTFRRDCNLASFYFTFATVITTFLVAS